MHPRKSSPKIFEGQVTIGANGRDGYSTSWYDLCL